MWCSTNKISLSINHQATTKKKKKKKKKKKETERKKEKDQKKKSFLIMLGIMGKMHRTILIVGCYGNSPSFVVQVVLRRQHFQLCSQKAQSQRAIVVLLEQDLSSSTRSQQCMVIKDPMPVSKGNFQLSFWLTSLLLDFILFFFS